MPDSRTRSRSFRVVKFDMKLSIFSAGALSLASVFLAIPQKRDESQFHVGQPISGDGKGAPIVGECIRRIRR